MVWITQVELYEPTHFQWNKRFFQQEIKKRIEDKTEHGRNKHTTWIQTEKTNFL